MTRHTLLWLIAIVAIFIFSPLVLSQSAYRECYQKELSIAHDFYGPEEVSSILQRAQRIYGFAMVDTGLDAGIQNLNTPIITKEISPNVDLPKYLWPFADQMAGYWSGLLDNIFLFCLRLSHAWLWLGYLTPFMFAIIFDGVMTRRAKLASFQYTSPTVYNLSWHVIIAIVSISFFCFSITTPVTVYAYPLVISIIGVLVRLVLSNVLHSE